MTTFGVDMGNSALKLDGPLGGLYLPSIAASVVSRQIKPIYGMKADRPPLCIKHAQGAFFVGERAYNFGRVIQNYDFERLKGTPEVRALLYAGFTGYSNKFGGITDSVTCIVGLPLEYYKESADTDRNLDEVRRWIVGHHTWMANEVSFELDVATVFPTSQAAGALFDYALDHEGKTIPANAEVLKLEIGIISIGFGTVEIQVVNGGKLVDFRSDSSTNGVRRLLELLDQDSKYSTPELDEMLRSGGLNIQGSLDTYFSELIGFIERKWDSRYWKRLSKIIVVGGGAKFLGEKLKLKFGVNRVVIPTDPVMTIANGLFKLGTRSKSKK